MASPKQSKGAARIVPPDLEDCIRDAVRNRPGLTSVQLMKELPPSHRPFAKEVNAAVQRVVVHGDVYRFLKGKKALLFPAEPLMTLDNAISPRLVEAPLDKEGLRRLVEEVAPGHAIVLDAWLKRALTQRTLYEHPASSKGAKKRYSSSPPEPDLRKLFAPLLTAARKARQSLDAKGIAPEKLGRLVMEALGVAGEKSAALVADKPGNGNPPNGDARAQFLGALTTLGTENSRDALHSVRDLRARLALSKEQFDSLALALMRDGAISLHHHDHPASLPEQERRQLVQDSRGNYYVGIAPRSRH